MFYKYFVKAGNVKIYISSKEYNNIKKNPEKFLSIFENPKNVHINKIIHKELIFKYYIRNILAKEGK